MIFFAYSFTDTWMKPTVWSCFSSTKVEQSLRKKYGANLSGYSTPSLKVIAERNSNLLSGRSANATQPSTHLIL